jgi:O-antigen/teichoic acid export membrane protein
MLLLIPAVIFIILLGDKILLVFGAEYSVQSFELLRLFAVSSVFATITWTYISVKQIQRDIKKINYVEFTTAVLILGLGYVLLQKYGLIGVGYAWLVAWLVTYAAMGVVLTLSVIRQEKWS